MGDLRWGLLMCSRWLMRNTLCCIAVVHRQPRCAADGLHRPLDGRLLPVGAVGLELNSVLLAVLQPVVTRISWVIIAGNGCQLTGVVLVLE